MFLCDVINFINNSFNRQVYTKRGSRFDYSNSKASTPVSAFKLSVLNMQMVASNVKLKSFLSDFLVCVH